MTADLALVPFSFSGYKGLAFHRLLLEDSVRTESFRRAIANVVKEGDVVVDLGAGTGILSYFACQAGAARVYAIESDSIIEVARQVARQNGMADRITFIKESSWMTNLPENVDVVVSECIGWFALGGTMIAAVTQIRDRYLKQVGRVIPRSISMFIVPVQSQRHFSELDYWKNSATYGIDMSALDKMVKNNVYLTTMESGSYVSDPQRIETIDLSQGHPNEMLDAKAVFPIADACRIHGLCGWFDVDLCEGVAFSTSPDRASTVWRQVFFPFEREVEVEAGSVVDVRLVLRRSETDVCGCFEWAVGVGDGAGRRMIGRQSTRSSYPYDIADRCEGVACRPDVDGRTRNGTIERRELLKWIVTKL